MRYAMIMAGGAGTRLWPMSRQDRPKQLVPFIRRHGRASSLLEIAAERLEGLVPPERRYICTNEAYRASIRAALPRFSDAQILGEPVGRDTVNAVGFAAAVLQKLDPGALFAVLTADHLIEPADLFRDRMEQGFELVEQDPTRLVTFSIKPTHPATGFGYVERGASIPGTGGLGFRVERFVEKPSREKAQAYIESGAFGWNSGMFVWKASAFLDCLRRYKPESHAGLMKIASAWGTKDQKRVVDEVYPTLPKISVDYAVMEPATREQARTPPGARDGVKVCTVLMDLTWLDVGSWPSFATTLDPDAQGNRVSGKGIAFRCKDTLVVNADDRHTVALLGCEGLTVVHTEDATLVMPSDRAEELKLLHAELAEKLK
ncbi:MAG TPA: mannose-1-phosphate guanyltransferase [Phycisphaerales bacterium]|nr:mannose-1-phosphate guanyltransferase [Phycisphaerales bacterium]